MVLVFPNFDMLESDKFIRFVEEIRQVDCPQCKGSFYTSGESTVYYEIVKMVFKEGKYLLGFALLMVLGSLLVNFRSLHHAFMVFTPLAVGMLATLGWMGVLGISFNIINLAALPIILGTADDYAVHLYQRYLNHPDRSLSESYSWSLRPIIGSSLTTLVGFGSLLVADMGGMRSFGLVCVTGIFLCTITTLLWFPAVITLLKRRRNAISPEVSILEEV
jgi:hypothetical protein